MCINMKHYVQSATQHMKIYCDEQNISSLHNKFRVGFNTTKVFRLVRIIIIIIMIT